jgi:hypothetical protein
MKKRIAIPTTLVGDLDDFSELFVLDMAIESREKIL